MERLLIALLLLCLTAVTWFAVIFNTECVFEPRNPNIIVPTMSKPTLSEEYVNEVPDNDDNKDFKQEAGKLQEGCDAATNVESSAHDDCDLGVSHTPTPAAEEEPKTIEEMYEEEFEKDTADPRNPREGGWEERKNPERSYPPQYRHGTYTDGKFVALRHCGRRHKKIHSKILELDIGQGAPIASRIIDTGDAKFKSFYFMELLENSYDLCANYSVPDFAS